MISDLTAKVAVVTGGASGIGLALTEQFVAEGAKVVMADIEESVLAEQAARLERAGADVLGVLCDVRDIADVQRLADQTIEHFGAVHIVCNNAGVAPAGPMLESTAAEWKWLLDVNVLGVAHGVITFGPLLVEAGEGHIVNTASEAGLVTNAMLGAYMASKHAVVGLSEALYKELEETPVGVSVLCPELVKTRIFESERNAPAAVEDNPAAMAPLREGIQLVGIEPADVAREVLDAIATDRFWVFTHPTTLPHALVRFEDLQAGRNPTDAYADRQSV
ncbi:MAG: SDR family NAD(P)-dependent oxidoreductase [Acidimicrobiales bacterium]|nr:SDR family NAD(P)-dependent oxidoreductase [Acidimicrobiales bacterium]